MSTRHGSQQEPQQEPERTTKSHHSRDSFGSGNGDSLKRPRADELAASACDLCRSRKVRCDRQQPVCSNCQKAGAMCNSSNPFKRRVNHTKQLRDDFSIVMDRLNEVDQHLGILTKLTQQIASRPACTHVSSHFDSPASQHAPSQRPLLSDNYRGTIPHGSAHDEVPILKSASDDRGVNTRAILEDVGHEHDYYPTHETVELEHGSKSTYSNLSSLDLIESISRELTHGLEDESSGDNNVTKANGNSIVCQTSVNNDRCVPSLPVVSQAKADEEIPEVRGPVKIHPAARQQFLDRFPLTGKYQETAITCDSKPITSPPRLVVSIFVETFLRNINTRFPIFEESSLRQAINMHYQLLNTGTGKGTGASTSGNPTPPPSASIEDSANENIYGGPSWALIFSNIAVLGLGLELQLARVPQASSNSMTNMWNDDLVPSLLRNSDRALASLETFSRPSLLNVQALTAREFYSNSVFGDVCQRACQVGRLMGLNLFYSSPNINTDGESYGMMERERIFRVLYSMDKQRAFISGQACEMFTFDWDPHRWDIGRSNDDGDRGKSGLPLIRLINDAFDDMMRIWEEIYLALDCSRAIDAGPAHLNREVARVSKLIDEWNQEHGHVMHARFLPPSNTTATTAATSTSGSFGSPEPGNMAEYELGLIQLELKYCYHVTRILCLRHDHRNNHAQQQLRNHARICLKLISEVVKSPISTMTLSTLGRILGNYPAVPFIDLLNHRISVFRKPSWRDDASGERQRPSEAMSSASDTDLSESSEAEARADVELLEALPRQLQLLQQPNYPNVYFNRLKLGLDQASQIIDVMKESDRFPKLQNQSQPRPADNPKKPATTSGSTEHVQPTAIARSYAVVQNSSVPKPPTGRASFNPAAMHRNSVSASKLNHLQKQQQHQPNAPPPPHHQQPQHDLTGTTVDDFLQTPQRQTSAAGRVAGLEMMEWIDFNFYTPITTVASPDVLPAPPSSSAGTAIRQSLVSAGHASPRQQWSETIQVPTTVKGHTESNYQGMDPFQELYMPEHWDMADIIQ
ncbi:Transcriptional activator protein acu-15 [Cytospora mali]|uniref:Transcriptional activator protein acu-15 n=1 Tax=Cytospora mali TaxID=578113 RepID=A0A194UM99_CYTMA|nr:Transcriptional activator protein acu-15 [Valsa mali var. pyri (nom. inval.)]